MYIFFFFRFVENTSARRSHEAFPFCLALCLRRWREKLHSICFAVFQSGLVGIFDVWLDQAYKRSQNVSAITIFGMQVSCLAFGAIINLFLIRIFLFCELHMCSAERVHYADIFVDQFFTVNRSTVSNGDGRNDCANYEKGRKKKWWPLFFFASYSA